MLKALILDDELTNISVLKYDLELYCPDVKVVADFTNPVEALKYLSTNQVDVVFLDVTMPIMTGFEFLNCQKNIEYQVVFVTAHQEYAINAFDFYAVDYLVKPVSSQKLIRAVDRIKEKLIKGDKKENMDAKLAGIQSHNLQSGYIAIPTIDGYEMLNQEEILYMQASGNYTSIRLINKELLVSKNIGEFEKIMDAGRFIRIHNSALVQISKIKKYIRGDGGQVLMSDGKSLSVSRINKPRLLSVIRVEF
jgi:two-component system LytT family response regulator